MNKAASLRWKKAMKPYTWVGDEVCSECGASARWRGVYMHGSWHEGTFFGCDSHHKGLPSYWEYDSYHSGRDEIRWSEKP